MSQVFSLEKLAFGINPTMARDFLSRAKSLVIFFISLPVVEYKTTKNLQNEELSKITIRLILMNKKIQIQ